MTITEANLSLFSFIVTYNFTAMMSLIIHLGMALGFYGGISVVGWVYQTIFIPETKNKKLEKIEELIPKSMSGIVCANLKNAAETVSDLAHLRLRKVFPPSLALM